MTVIGRWLRGSVKAEPVAAPVVDTRLEDWKAKFDDAYATAKAYVETAEPFNRDGENGFNTHLRRMVQAGNMVHAHMDARGWNRLRKDGGLPPLLTEERLVKRDPRAAAMANDFRDFHDTGYMPKSLKSAKADAADQKEWLSRTDRADVSVK